MRNVTTIASREFRRFFVSPEAYAVAAVFLLILGGIFFLNVYYGLQTGQVEPDGRTVLNPLVTILLFATPAITMRLLADEQRMGTIELLLTAPIRDWELVVGKWLGAMGFMLLLLGVTWVYPIIMNGMTQVVGQETGGIDQGVLVSAYLGLILMTGALLAIGVFVSSLFRSPVAAFFVTLGVLLGMWILGGFGSGAGTGAEIIRYLSLVNHYYDNMYRGVLVVSDMLFYVSLTALALFLGSQITEARRWR